jgi:hypothetical protein
MQNMRFAKYWIRDSAPEARGSFLAWGWSNKSLEDARALAVQRSRSLMEWFRKGQLRHYPYAEADRPLREETVESLASADGREPEAVITRNSYGALVLNASHVLFADLDMDGDGSGSQPVPASQPGGLWGMLFGAPKQQPPSPPVQRQVARVEAFARANPSMGIRLYRTCAGYRAVILNQIFDPLAAQSERILRELDADPLYVRLCRSQQCFRARLTPKPWRCGFSAPRETYPYVDTHVAAQMQRWIAQYTQRAAGYTTCQIVGSYGPEQQHPEVARVLSVHDRYAVGRSGLPLA